MPYPGYHRASPGNNELNHNGCCVSMDCDLRWMHGPKWALPFLPWLPNISLYHEQTAFVDTLRPEQNSQLLLTTFSNVFSWMKYFVFKQKLLKWVPKYLTDNKSTSICTISLQGNNEYILLILLNDLLEGWPLQWITAKNKQTNKQKNQPIFLSYFAHKEFPRKSLSNKEFLRYREGGVSLRQVSCFIWGCAAQGSKPLI